MKKSMTVAALAAAAAGGAWAEVQVYPVMGVGATAGGDTLRVIPFKEGHTETVRAGGLYAMHGGVEMRFTDFASFQALVGYHVDQVKGQDEQGAPGKVAWERTPIEFLGHYQLADWVRLGGGARYTTNVRLRGSGIGRSFVSEPVRFKPTWGSVVEAEFFPVPTIGIKLRYVSEKFQPKDSSIGDAVVKGNHGGLYLNYYFF